VRWATLFGVNTLIVLMPLALLAAAYPPTRGYFSIWCRALAGTAAAGGGSASGCRWRIWGSTAAACRMATSSRRCAATGRWRPRRADLVAALRVDGMYGQRWTCETVHSVIKRTTGGTIRSRLPRNQRLEPALKGLVYNPPQLGASHCSRPPRA
jgi:hypothetical protein